MTHQNIWRDTCHNIAKKPSPDSCDGTKEHQKERIFHVAMRNSCVHPYNCKNPKSDRVHDQHNLVIGFSVMPLQKLLLKIQDRKNNTGCDHCHNRIDRMLEHGRRHDSEDHITDSTSSDCCCNTKHDHPKNIHRPVHRNHCTGCRKSDCPDHFHHKCNKLLIIHNFPLPQFLPYHIFRVTLHRNSFDTLFPLYYTFLFLQFNITKFFIL